MVKKTQDLLEILKGLAQPEDYIESEEDNLVKTELHEYIQNILDTKGISRGELIKNSGLDRTYTYQILSGAKSICTNFSGIPINQGLSASQTVQNIAKTL